MSSSDSGGTSQPTSEDDALPATSLTVGSADPTESSESAEFTGAVEVFVADEQDDVEIDTDRWLRLAVQVLHAQGVTGRYTPDVEMSLYFVDEASIAALNQQYMGKEGPTDVLSFPIDGDETVSNEPGRMPDNSPRGPNDDGYEPDDDQPLLLGDVLISPTVAMRNAVEHLGPHHDGTIEDELALLVVHGILHLLGMDHIVEAEAEVMEARERVLLHQFHRPILSDDEQVTHGLTNVLSSELSGDHQ
jgi:probable rRNA maturation factor